MTSVALTKDKHLRVVDEEAQGKPQMVPKPRFLEQLEAFLKKELVAMGVQDVGPSELRLQVGYQKGSHGEYKHVLPKSLKLLVLVSLFGRLKLTFVIE